MNAAEARRGGSVGYSAYHVIEALRALSSGVPLGRPRLQSTLGIGEAAVKTLLSRLEELGLAEKVPQGRGHTATPSGANHYKAVSSALTYYRLRATPIGEAAAIASPILDPAVDLVGVYKVRDYLVAENCKVSIVGGVVDGVPHYPGVPEEERCSLTAWDPGIQRGLIVIVPLDCLKKAYTGLLKLIDKEYCGDT